MRRFRLRDRHPDERKARVLRMKGLELDRESLSTVQAESMIADRGIRAPDGNAVWVDADVPDVQVILCSS